MYTLQMLNDMCSEHLKKSNSVDMFAKSITHFVFRNGPVEDMHSAGQLSEDDMKTLNKYMVNGIATILHMMYEGKWTELYSLLYSLRYYGSDWDKAEIDTELLASFSTKAINELEKINRERNEKRDNDLPNKQRIQRCH